MAICNVLGNRYDHVICLRPSGG